MIINGEMVKENTENKLHKCIICDEEDGKYYIKGSKQDTYCEECAKDFFGDISYLEKL